MACVYLSRLSCEMQTARQNVHSNVGESTGTETMRSALGCMPSLLIIITMIFIITIIFT